MDLLHLSPGLGAESMDLGPRGFLRFVSPMFGTLLVHFTLPGAVGNFSDHWEVRNVLYPNSLTLGVRRCCRPGDGMLSNLIVLVFLHSKMTEYAKTKI